MAKLTGLETKALDFVLAFPREDLDTPVYMELPIGVSYDGVHQNRKYVLLILSRSYTFVSSVWL